MQEQTWRASNSLVEPASNPRRTRSWPHQMCNHSSRVMGGCEIIWPSQLRGLLRRLRRMGGR